MEAAEDVLADENATQAEVDDAKAALESAIDQLTVAQPTVDKDALLLLYNEST